MAVVEKPVTAISVANYLLKRHEEKQGEGIDQLKLLKLVYLCHGWYLGYYGAPLVDEAAEAWPYGPVYPSIFANTKKDGRLPVPFPIGDGKLPKFTDQQKEIMDAVHDSYTRLSGLHLMLMSHRRGTPWYKVWTKTNGKRSPIADKLIRRHYEAKANG